MEVHVFPFLDTLKKVLSRGTGGVSPVIEAQLYANPG